MNRSCSLLFLVTAAMPAMEQLPASRDPDTLPSRTAVTVKLGYSRLADTSQTLAGSDWSFDRSTIKLLAIEAETRVSRKIKDLTIGGEYLMTVIGFTETSGASSDPKGSVYAPGLFAKAKYYFGPEEGVRPYIGGGVGMMFAADFVGGGPIPSVAFGPSYLGGAGMQLRSRMVGFRLEYTGLRARLAGGGERTNLSAHYILAGLSVYFGQ